MLRQTFEKFEEFCDTASPILLMQGRLTLKNLLAMNGRLKFNIFIIFVPVS